MSDHDEGEGGQAEAEPAAAARPDGLVEAHEPVTLSFGEYEELKTLAKERDAYLRQLQRAVADFQNLQKRTDRMREGAQEQIVRTLTQELAPVADDLARALEAAEQTPNAQGIVKGLRLVEAGFYAALARFGVRPLNPVGQEFDPHSHEAVMQERAEGVPPNTVLRELRRGFALGDVVVRPSQVVVTAPEPPGDSETGSTEA